MQTPFSSHQNPVKMASKPKRIQRSSSASSILASRHPALQEKVQSVRDKRAICTIAPVSLPEVEIRRMKGKRIKKKA